MIGITRCLAVLVLISAIGVNAAVCKWNVPNGKWNDAESWDGKKVPGETDTALFDGKDAQKVIIKKPVKVQSIKVAKSCFVRIDQRSDVAVSGDFILLNGAWLAGKSTLTCGGDFISEKTTFKRGSSCVVLTGSGRLKGMFFNKIVMAGKGCTTTLLSRIHPFAVELGGGTLNGEKNGIFFYSETPTLKGFDVSAVNVGYIALRPAKDCFIELPPIKISGGLFLRSYGAKSVFSAKNLLQADKGISLQGDNYGVSILEVNGGTVMSSFIKVGVINKDSAGQLRLFAGTLALKDGVYIYNDISSLVRAEDFPLPEIKYNKGSISIE